MPPKIGIVILNWNNWQDTIDCVSQIQGVDYPQNKIEIIIVDNGSKDDSISQLSQLTNTQLISLEENLGFAGGTNIGLKQGIQNGCDYLLVLNNDTVLQSGFLKPLVNLIEGNESIGIVTPKILKREKPDVLWYAGGFFQKFRILGPARGAEQTDRGQWDQACPVEFAFGCCMLIRAKLLEMIGYFDEDFFFYFEDYDLCLRTLKAGYAVWYEPRSIIYHEGSKSTQDMQPLRVHLFVKSRMIFFFKHIRGLNIPIMFLMESVKTLRNLIGFLKSNRPDLSKSYLDGLKSGIKFSIQNIRNTRNPEQIKVTKSKWKFFYRITGWIFFLIVIGYLTRRAIDGISLIRESQLEFSVKFLLLSFLCQIIGYLIAAGVWSDILRQLKINSEYSFDLAAFSLSALGRKIPGLVVYALGRLLLYTTKKAPKPPIILGMLIETILFSLAGLIGIIYVTSRTNLQIGWLGNPWILILILTVIIILLGVAGPKIIQFFIKFQNRHDPNPLPENTIKISTIDTLKWLIGELLVVALASGVMYFFFKSLSPENNIPHYSFLAAFAIPVFVAPIAIWLPGDLGLRDGLLYLLISPWLGPSLAALFTLAVRIWISLLEISFGLISGIYLSRIIDLRKLRISNENQH